jgi:polar amino acid transport system substrate-binding protein
VALLAGALACCACAPAHRDVTDQVVEALAGSATSEPPTTTTTSTPTTAPAATAPPATTVPCSADGMNRSSYEPTTPPPEPGAMPPASSMADIVTSGELVVGVDENTMPLSFRNPRTGVLEGFEVDLARELAARLFGTDGPSPVRFVTVTTDEKTAVVEDGRVDMTIDAASMTCKRWNTGVSFSAAYYEADHVLMVRADDASAEISGLSDLAGHRVCVTKGSSTLDLLAAVAPDVEPYEVDTRTDCLIALRDGDADAIFSHDTFLVGLHQQDPNTRIIDEPIQVQPYGIVIRDDRIDLVRFVNAALEDMRHAPCQAPELAERGDGPCLPVLARAWSLDESRIPLPQYGLG